AREPDLDHASAQVRRHAVPHRLLESGELLQAEAPQQLERAAPVRGGLGDVLLDVGGLAPHERNLPKGASHSPSVVAGGLGVTSRTTRLTCGISFTIRDETSSTRSYGSRAQSAVIASSEVTARITTG